jgi:RimJ/RimL family protein N-acetyltransferase
MAVVLETGRLVLRRLTEADAGNLLMLESDPDVVRHLGRQPLPDADACRRHIRCRVLPSYGRPGGHGVWAVLERTGGAFVGVCSLKPALDARYASGMGYRPDEAELGYGLRKASWGSGYATELARALVRRALLDLGQARVVASVAAANAASIRVLEKAGLLREGGLFFLPGEGEPSLRYGLAREQLRPPTA